MKLVTAYETSDLRLFKQESEAILHQTILDLQAEIISLLGGPSQNISLSFVDGDGYYQLSEENYKSALALIESLKQLVGIPSNYNITSRYCYEHYATTHIGAIIATIDENSLKRYGQPFFKLHPTQCTSQTNWNTK